VVKFIFAKETYMKSILPLLFLTFLWTMSAAAQSINDYQGYWWNEDRSGIVELIVSADSIEGITRWGKTPDTDKHNPDPALRERSLKDISFLWGFSYDAKHNSWQDGKVYDPKNGKTYDAKMSLSKSGDELEMRGYVGISLFGRTAVFTRVKEGELPEVLKGKAVE
jgi:uncharacterized protein (DUF2147 family)